MVPGTGQDSYPWQGMYPLPTGHDAPPLGGGGCQSQFPAPGGEGVGGGVNRLVQYNSITVTRDPSDIAFDALKKLDKGDREYRNCVDFVDYLDKCEQKRFLIKGYDTKKGKPIHLPLEYNNRWGPSRRAILSEKLKRLEYWFEMQEDRPVTLVTFTSEHKGYDIAGAWRELNKGKDKLRKLIHKYFGNIDYFWVVEPHQDGYAHYHMAAFATISNDLRYFKHKYGIDWFIADVKIEDKFRDIWSKKYKTGNHTYGLDFAQKKDESKIKKMKNYLQKYLQKGFLFDKWTPGMLKFNAAMWTTGFRMYGASKHIREIMNIEDEKPCQVVWLETKIKEPEAITEDIIDNTVWPPKKQSVTTIIESERVIWYRQYIPDWLDSDFWIWNNEIRQGDPPAQYIYNWGRPCSHHAIEYKVMEYQPKRKTNADPYEEFNKQYIATYINK